MDRDSSQSDPIVEELARAERTSRRSWWLEGLRIPDFGEMAEGWAHLPRGGRWIGVLILIGLIMLLPITGIAVALLG